MSNKTFVRYKLGRLYIRVIFIGIFLSIVVAACGTTGQETRNEVEVTPAKCDHCAGLQVMTNKQSYTQTEPITVTAKLMAFNESHVTFAYYGTPLQNFLIELVDEQGLPVALTNKGLEDSYEITPRVLDSLGPERPLFEETFQINPWFDLSRSGTYTLTAKTRVWIEYQAVDLISNPVVFTLLP